MFYFEVPYPFMQYAFIVSSSRTPLHVAGDSWDVLWWFVLSFLWLPWQFRLGQKRYLSSFRTLIYFLLVCYHYKSFINVSCCPLFSYSPIARLSFNTSVFFFKFYKPWFHRRPMKASSMLRLHIFRISQMFIW